MIVAIFQAVVKPAIDGVATSVFSRRAIRGGWEQRAETDMLGTWEVHTVGIVPNAAAEHIRLGLAVWKSEAFIVVSEKERGSGRRGAAVDQQPTIQGDPLG